MNKFLEKICVQFEHALEVLVTIVCVLLIVCGIYALYDNSLVIQSGSAAQWQPYKPKIPNETASFEELQKINSDVIGWLDIYGTNIDYPLLYSDDMEFYLTHNARKEYSLTGSLFLDKQNSPLFTDRNTIVYGHHMEADAMFGEIENFLKKEYFDEHRYGRILFNGMEKGIEILASFSADAYDGTVYRHIEDAHDFQIYVEYVHSKAAQIYELPKEGDILVTCSTCSLDGTNARTLVTARLLDEVPEDTFVTWPNIGTGVEIPQWSFFGGMWVLIILLSILGVSVCGCIYFHMKERKKIPGRAEKKEFSKK